MHAELCMHTEHSVVNPLRLLPMVFSEPAMLLTAYPYHFQALGANEPSLLAVLLIIPVGIGLLFAGWQGYQDDDEDFFDTYESRRVDFENSNRNRV